MDHLSQVAADRGVVFRGERGPRMDQIAAIKAKEIYEGALAASRAQAELARKTAPAAGDPVQAALDPSSNSESLPARVEIPCVTPQMRGNRGRPPRRRPGSRPLVGPALSPVRGLPPPVFPNEYTHKVIRLEHEGVWAGGTAQSAARVYTAGRRRYHCHPGDD